MKSRCNSDAIRMHLITSKLDQIINQKLDQQFKTLIKNEAGCNLDTKVIESEMHLITSKFDQNSIQKPDQ